MEQAIVRQLGTTGGYNTFLTILVSCRGHERYLVHDSKLIDNKSLCLKYKPIIIVVIIAFLVSSMQIADLSIKG